MYGEYRTVASDPCLLRLATALRRRLHASALGALRKGLIDNPRYEVQPLLSERGNRLEARSLVGFGDHVTAQP